MLVIQQSDFIVDPGGLQLSAHIRYIVRAVHSAVIIVIANSLKSRLVTKVPMSSVFARHII
jgi:hypothetical protein